MLAISFHLANAKKQKLIALYLLALIVLCEISTNSLAFAQTKPATASNQGQVAGGSQQPSGSGRSTENTVPNPYEDAEGNLGALDRDTRQNQRTIQDGVDTILTRDRDQMSGQYSYAPLVFQAAEQNQGSSVQQAANNILNASIGEANETYKGLHQWWKDDLVGNLFGNIGQLIGKWLSEFINGWVSDAVQYLAKFLRIFVLNPNIAVNGLGNGQDDGISALVRQGADVMYGIAVDLLLLLFILCIWKFWAEAAWRGAGNLMGAVGRLIFTAGLLLAWPTLYAFEVQISNEMIKAIYFSSSREIMMLDYALAQAVKGGLAAAGAGAFSVFAPVLANLAVPVAGSFIGSLFWFASILVFTILGGILIAELVYILILKAIQTALLTAQYMFAPVFLVFFATPDTENVATGFVRSFVEVSLWTFVWVGLLRIMAIIMFSDFNPWGKILIAIGVLQLMIQVPAFLARAQISPMSDFLTAGLITGTALKAFSGLGGALTSATNKGISWWTNERYADRGLQLTKEPVLSSLPTETSNPALKASLDAAAANNKGKTDPLALATTGPQLKTPGSDSVNAGTAEKDKDKNAAAEEALKGKQLNPATGENKDSKIDATKQAAAAAEQGKQATMPGAAKNLEAGTPGPKPLGSGLGTVAASAAGIGAVAATLNQAQKQAEEKDKAAGAGTPEVPTAPDLSTGNKPKEKFAFGRSSAEGWNEPNLIHVDTRKLVGKLTSVDGVGLRVGQDRNSVLGSTAHGVQRVNIAEGATESELAHAIYSAAFTNNIAHDDPAKDAARKSAISAGANRPKGFMQGMAANWLSNTGGSWNQTAMAKEQFQQAMFEQAALGAQAFVSKQKGNEYTQYLRNRYGEWTDDQDAMATHLISNPDSSESPWNRNVMPATERLVASGIPIGADTRGAAQNMAIQAMHPARQKQAIFAALSYTHEAAKEKYGNEHPIVMALAHGEMARSLSTDEVNTALEMYQVGGQDDLRPSYAGHVSGLAGAAGVSPGQAYASLTTAAIHGAHQKRLIPSGVSIGSLKTMSDLEAIIVPMEGSTQAQTMQTVLQATSSDLQMGQLHNIPMRTMLNPELAAPIYNFLGDSIGQLNTPSGHRKLNVIARNLNTIGAMHSKDALEAMYVYAQEGGQLDRMDSVRINLATRAFSAGREYVRPEVIEVAAAYGYGMNDAEVNWADVAQSAGPYITGQVKDYRFAKVVGNLVQANIAPTNQNIQVAVESMAASGGEFQPEHVEAVMRVSSGMRTPTFAPKVIENFAHQYADDMQIDGASNMNLPQLLNALGRNDFGPKKLAQEIVTFRTRGGFSDQQLMEPSVVEVLLDPVSGYNKGYGPAAVSVVSRIHGGDKVARERSGPQNRNIDVDCAVEYLDNEGVTNDFDYGALQAARTFYEVRGNASHPSHSTLSNIKITPRLVSMIQGHSSYSINDTALSEELISKIVNKYGGGDPNLGSGSGGAGGPVL